MVVEANESGSGVVGGFVDRAGERVYMIDGAESMAPFLMTVVCDDDLWLYASSSGGLTAGRVDSERSLFPYVNDDQLHASGGITGPVTVLRVRSGDGSVREWAPLDPRTARSSGVRVRIFRSLLGDDVMFESSHDELGLTFRTGWSLSAAHGIVRSAELERHAGASEVEVEIIDGLLNVMPASVPGPLQLATSTLVDAYKRTELDPETGMALFVLESAISDRAEPGESMLANVVWRVGLADAEVALSSEALDAYRRTGEFRAESLATGRRGAYLCRARRRMVGGDRESWILVGDVHLDPCEVVRRRRVLREASDMRGAVLADLAAGRDRLARLLAGADSEQCSADESVCAYHRSNVLFNCMRGGTFIDGAEIEVSDLRRFIEARNASVGSECVGVLSGLGDRTTPAEMHAAARASGNADLRRLCMEYLPLTFGRRHGDPSRPWNRFTIRVRNADGSRMLDYQGNWRDIFQNWEALCRSHPEFLQSVIAKFLNASTADGFNPYRISREGIDWERPNPSDPWANIGYWGDHQIIYLLRLLEQSEQTWPGLLAALLHEPVFSYANVPYRIKPFDDIVRNSKQSIDFDRSLHDRIEARARDLGADGRLTPGLDGRVLHVTLLEKLLVPALSKVSNLVPGGGIWLNTQRPEWNDANNALVGAGLSMVTLFQLRRYADFCVELLSERDETEAPVSELVVEWCDAVLKILVEHLELVEPGTSMEDSERRSILDRLGRAFSAYREQLYRKGPGEAVDYPLRAVTDFFRLTRHYCDHSIARSRREDGLHESYMILDITSDAGRATVSSLFPMLEGQVAALSSGAMSASEAGSLLDRMFASGLHRADQSTFMLYPNRPRPEFLDRGVIPESSIDGCPVLARILESGVDSIASRDVEGRARFNGHFMAGSDLAAALAALAERPEWSSAVEAGREAVLSIYDEVFGHREFIGRSGCMHKFEGLGSIYWHMVSKLLLAVQECAFEASDRGEPADAIAALTRSYYDVRDGLGFNRGPETFGAFPHEPYSHTPLHAGAQQPGMTGQVKEGVLARFGELGLRLIEGRLRFDPMLLRRCAFLDSSATWRLFDSSGQAMEIELPAGSIGLTYCQTPVVLRLGERAGLELTLRDGTVEAHDGLTLPRDRTVEVLRRAGTVVRIDATIPAELLASI